MQLRIVNESVLDGPGFIIHQCNCASIKAAGVAAQLFAVYPEAGYEAISPELRKLGKWSAHRAIVNIYAQLYPGSVYRVADTRWSRLENFKNAFSDFLVKTRPCLVRIPYGVGCGLAGGIWGDYMDVISDLSIKFPDTQFTICKYTEPNSMTQIFKQDLSTY